MDIIPVIDIDRLLRDESAALSELSTLTGPEPDRFPSLFADPWRCVPGPEVYDSLSPLERAAFDFFQQVTEDGSLKKFCKEPGGVFSATHLARRMGVAYDMVRSPDGVVRDDDLSEYVNNIVRIGLIGVSSPDIQATIVEMGTATGDTGSGQFVTKFQHQARLVTEFRQS